MPDRYDSTRRAWEDIWEKATIEVELEAAAYARSHDTIDAYLPFLAKQDIHLEAGSGLSAIVLTLRQRGYNVHGLDYAVNALLASRRFDASLPLAAGDVHHLPYRDSSFGSYLSFGVLEHFEGGMLPALREAYRVVKPGGVLVLTIPYPNLIYNLVQWRRRLSGQGPLTDDAFYESTYTRRQLRDVVMEAGFSLELSRPTSHSFTLWQLGGPFRSPGYYRTSPLAETLGALLNRILPWPTNYSTLIVARKQARRR